MKLNFNTKIIGTNVILVPYLKNHVAKYHEWMKSDELQELTASEPLTLEEEYQMQVSWREDEDKCTFIILDKQSYEETHDEIESMIGDTNIFITDKESNTGEIEIMIAEVKARGKKLGWESVVLMLLYGINYVNIKRYEAKISFTNTRSIKMFNKLGFREKCRSEVFKELTLEKNVDDTWNESLNKETCYEINEYMH